MQKAPHPIPYHTIPYPLSSVSDIVNISPSIIATPKPAPPSTKKPPLSTTKRPKTMLPDRKMSITKLLPDATENAYCAD